MIGMFMGCTNLKYLDISNFDLNGVIFDHAFYKMSDDAVVYVYSSMVQSLILKESTTWRPNWTTDNVIVKTA